MIFYEHYKVNENFSRFTSIDMTFTDIYLYTNLLKVQHSEILNYCYKVTCCWDNTCTRLLG